MNDAPRTRERILDAALTLFAEQGYDATSMREISEQLGITKAALHYHFASKAQLYAAVMARILDRIEAELMRSLAEGGGPLRRLERWLDVVIDVLAAHPTYARLLLRSLFEDDELTGALPEEQAVRATLERNVGAAHRLLRDGITQGVFRPVSVPHMVQSVIGLTVFHFASGEFGEEIIGRPLFSAIEVRRRKQEVKALIRHGLVLAPFNVAPGPTRSS